MKYISSKDQIMAGLPITCDRIMYFSGRALENWLVKGSCSIKINTVL